MAIDPVNPLNPNPRSSFSLVPELEELGFRLVPPIGAEYPNDLKDANRLFKNDELLVEDSLAKLQREEERAILEDRASELRELSKDERAGKRNSKVGTVLQIIGDALIAASAGQNAGSVAARLVLARANNRLEERALNRRREELEAERKFKSGENEKTREFTSTENQKDRTFRREENVEGRQFTAEEAIKDRVFRTELSAIDQANIVERMKLDLQHNLQIEGLRAADAKDLEKLRQAGRITQTEYEANLRLLNEVANRTAVHLVERGLAGAGEAQKIATDILHGREISPLAMEQINTLSSMLQLEHKTKQQADHFSLFLGTMRSLPDSSRGLLGDAENTTPEDVAATAYRLLPTDTKAVLRGTQFFTDIETSEKVNALETSISRRAQKIAAGEAAEYSYKELVDLNALYKSKNLAEEERYASLRSLGVSPSVASSISGYAAPIDGNLPTTVNEDEDELPWYMGPRGRNRRNE